MNVTIELSATEVMGIRRYLIDVNEMSHVSDVQVKAFVCRIVEFKLHAPDSELLPYVKSAEDDLSNLARSER